MKNQKARWFGSIAVLILLSTLGIAYGLLYHPEQLTIIEQLTAATLPVHRIAVIDFDQDGLTNQAEIQHGQDALLMIHTAGKDELFSSLGTLQKLDVNKNGVIDAHDPLFNALRLVYLKKGTRQTVSQSLTEAGIQSIKIQQTDLSKPATVNLIDNTIGVAHMRNGQHYLIRLIDIAATTT